MIKSTVLRSAILLGMLQLPLSCSAAAPESVAEIASAWRQYYDSAFEQSTWCIVRKDSRWLGADADGPGFRTDLSRYEIVDAAPLRLARQITQHDGKLVIDTSTASNRDYTFNVSKVEADASYDLRSLTAQERSVAAELETELQFWSAPWARALFGVDRFTFIEPLENHPEAFQLSIDSETGSTLMSFRHAQVTGTPRLAGFAMCKEGTILLSEHDPWLPVRYDLLLEYPSSKAFRQTLSFDLQAKKKRTIHARDDQAFLQVNEEYEIREPNEEELTQLTRTPAYGIPEPAIARRSTWPMLVAAIFGIGAIMFGTRLLQKRRANGV